jgi:hypothetical protein
LGELKNIDVDFLSVVDAGANGKPVLLAKSEAGATAERGENEGMGKENTQTQEEPFAKSNDDMKGFLNVVNVLKSIPGISSLLGQQAEQVAIQKGAVRDKFNNSRKASNFWDAWYAFEGTIRRYDWMEEQWKFEEDADKIREAVQDLTEIMQEILLTEDIAKAIGQPPEKIAKAGKKISSANQEKINAAITNLQEVIADVEGEEEIVKAEDIEKAVTAAVAPFAKQVEELTNQVAELKKEEGGGDAPAASDPEPVADPSTGADVITDAIAKALAPFQKHMETLANDVQVMKNTRGGSAQPLPDETIQKSAEVPSYIRLMEQN